MKWLVYYHAINEDKITTFNIFDHLGFAKEVEKALHSFKSREEFAKKLRSELFYYFGSKCEWEVIVSPWVGSRNKEGIKVDVYNQVMLNWDAFVDYVWTH
jgi:hypothetical protein